MNFANFFQKKPLAVLATPASFYCSCSYLLFTYLLFVSWLYIGILHSLCLFHNLAIFYDSCSYLSTLSVFYFLFLKLNLFPALNLCFVPFPFAFWVVSVDWALLDCVVDRKLRGIIFEANLSPSERNKNIQVNPEYNSILPFKINLKIFAVNMLQC